MTRKRYIRLMYALMQRINQRYISIYGHGYAGWGKVLKDVSRLKYGADKSYAEAWAGLKPIREQYGM
jgi:hypothetical protein